jgi:hypothetical protein
MSNPAIVLMTDPSRCSLGDMHHLVQALLEMQQMGQHAIPQAFCDHPEAAGDFIDAYTHAYPQLVLENGEIPTPDHLHSLISNGQIGAFGQSPELAPSGDLQPRAEPNGANGVNGVPIVMLTLGSSQALLDALQQAPAIRESIRLIDVGPERADALSVTVADAVAIRGLDGEPWQHARSSIDRLELDEIPGAWKADITNLALHDDQMSLDVVETAEVSSGEQSGYDQGGEHEPGPFEAPAPAAKPAAPAVDERPVSASPDEGRAGASATEQASEQATQTAAPRSSDSDLVEPGAQSPEPEAQAPDGAADEGPLPAGQAADKGPGKNIDQEGGKGPSKNVDKEVDKEVDAAEQAGKGAAEQDDDVYYPPVGSLLAGADVLYPALDQDGAHGALRELASVLLDDGIFDPDLAAGFIEAQRGEGLPAPARQEAIVAVPAGNKAVTFEDAYGAGDQESEDQMADANVPRPLHDSDL